MADERLIDIETKIAHQEHTIAELNDALASQQQQISILEVLLRTLTDRVRSISEAGPGGADNDAPPPHY